MKKNINIALFFLIFISFAMSCSDMDEYKKFIEGGEVEYTGKIDSVVVFSGEERLMVTGLFMSDPKITNCRIYWNLRADSLDVPVVRTGGIDTLKQLIQLPENLYNFEIFTIDRLGNKSVPVNAIGSTYGPLYRTSISNRLLNSAIVNETGVVTMEWRSIDLTLGAIKTEVEYMDNNGQMNKKDVSVNENSTLLENYKLESEIKYSTLYVPEALCIDTFRTAVATVTAIVKIKMDKSGWSIVDLSSAHDDGANSAKNIMDGTDATRWHTKADGRGYPHHVTVGLGKEVTISQFAVWGTTVEQSAGTIDSRLPTTIRLEVSMDNVVWTDLGEFSLNNEKTGAQYIEVPPTQASYFRFTGLKGKDNNMVVGEIDVYVK